MANILIAASPEPRAIVERILAGHNLTSAGKMAQAAQYLRKQAFDLIVCTIIFDDSRMFDLLRLAKSERDWARIPFVCVRVRAKILHEPIALEAVGFACRQLGAAAFLNIADYQTNPEREMRRAIEQLLKRNDQSA
jgi:DNA-binding NarL/FixJ family response regulator